MVQKILNYADYLIPTPRCIFTGILVACGYQVHVLTADLHVFIYRNGKISACNEINYSLHQNFDSVRVSLSFVISPDHCPFPIDPGRCFQPCYYWTISEEKIFERFHYENIPIQKY